MPVASQSSGVVIRIDLPFGEQGSLIANMIMGIIILRKRYVLSKYLSVLMITIGIVICTIISGSSVKSTANPDLIKDTDEPSAYSVLFWWTMGITLLTIALFISARMGIYQEVLYKRYGKHPREALYVTVSITVLHSNFGFEYCKIVGLGTHDESDCSEIYCLSSH